MTDHVHACTRLKALQSLYQQCSDHTCRRAGAHDTSIRYKDRSQITCQPLNQRLTFSISAFALCVIHMLQSPSIEASKAIRSFWKATEHAGYIRNTVAGSKIAVYPRRFHEHLPIYVKFSKQCHKRHLLRSILRNHLNHSSLRPQASCNKHFFVCIYIQLQL